MGREFAFSITSSQVMPMLVPLPHVEHHVLVCSCGYLVENEVGNIAQGPEGIGWYALELESCLTDSREPLRPSEPSDIPD